MALWNRSFRCRSLSWLGALVVGLGCVAPQEAPVVDPGVAEAEELRILSPFQATQTIASDRLELVMSANFFLHHLASPSHDFERKPQADGGAEYRYSNKSSDALQFHIANTKFAVTKSARIVVLGGSVTYQLSAHASGSVMVASEGIDRTLRAEVIIQNGTFRAQ